MRCGVLFLTYSSLIAASEKGRSRLQQIVAWCGPDYDGLLVYDECHKAKNLVPEAGGQPTRTGEAVLELQVGGGRWKASSASYLDPESEPRLRAPVPWCSGEAAPGAGRVLLSHGRVRAAELGVHDAARPVGAGHRLCQLPRLPQSAPSPFTPR